MACIVAEQNDPKTVLCCENPPFELFRSWLVQASLNAPLLFSGLFAIALLTSVGLKIWLSLRQMRHVSQHRTQVPAEFETSVSLASHQKAADYTLAKTSFGIFGLLFNAAVLVGWTLLGGLSSLNQALNPWLPVAEHPLTQQLLLLFAFTTLGGLIDLPFSLYQTFVIEARFGFNKMSLKLWLSDLLKSSVLGALVGLPLAALMLWLMGSLGNRWWIWAWVVWMAFNLLMLVIYPTWIAPLFNQFKPLDNPELVARVNALMARCGFSAKGFFVMDGSRRSGHANAYFTGFGSAKRVVFFDTLLEKLTPDEVDAVLAHELGHFKHKHILKRIVTMFAISGLGFALLGWAATQVWFYAGLGVEPNFGAPNNALALILFLSVVPVFSFFIAPLMSVSSRQHEFEADAYAKTQTSGLALRQALLKLIEDNASTLTPDPIYVKFYYSHPPATQRLARLAA
jgi:STE24 endopeptidase